MTTVSLCPTLGVAYQGFTVGGKPLSGGLIYSYIAGGTTLQDTYTTNAANVANANPIVLGSDGRPPNEIWLQYNKGYRFVITDSLGNVIRTFDNAPNGKYSIGGGLNYIVGTPADGTITASITANQSSVNLFTALSSPTEAIGLTVTINTGITVGSFAGTTSFASGSTITYVDADFPGAVNFSGGNPQPVSPLWVPQNFASFNLAIQGIPANAEDAATKSIAEYAGIGWTVTYAGGTLSVNTPHAAAICYQWTRTFVNPPGGTDFPYLFWIAA